MTTPFVRQLTFDELIQPADHDRVLEAPFPEAFANALAEAEAFNKHLFRPNTYLHKWWARRCGSTFRTILKQFVSDPSRRDYYAPGGLAGKVVLDPMMGGGTTLHEALRLGASVIGADVDPIPIVQARASLTRAPLNELRTAFDSFHHDLYRLIGSYFQTECPLCAQTVDSQFTLYGLRKRCACGDVVQIDQFDLRHEAGRVIRIWPETWAIGDDTQPPPAGAVSSPRLITKADTDCAVCGQKYAERFDLPFYARYAPIAIAAQCAQHGLFFRSPAESDLTRLRAADGLRGQLDFSPLCDFDIIAGPKSGDLLARQVHTYLELFSSRQLLYLHHAIQLLQSYQGAVKLNLALLVSTSLEFNAMLCGYKGWFKNRPGAIRHVFGLHAYVFQYTVAENNPVNRRRASGNLQALFRDRVERGRQWALAPVERKLGADGQWQQVKIVGEVDGGIEVADEASLQNSEQSFWLIHGDSRRLPVGDHAVDLVVTDPPYYDSVQYSDLATFFRVWLARLLPTEANWTYNIAHSAVASTAANGDTSFMAILGGILRECARTLKPDTGRLVFTFHHWDPNAWAELTLALRQAGFTLVSAHVVFSENPISAHIANLNALKHDTVLMFALRADHAPARWPPLAQIDSQDSETFGRGCSVAMGWLLEQDWPPEEIRATWRQLIPKRK